MATKTDPLIVVGVDGSSAAATALKWAVQQATAQHGSVRAVFVQHPRELMPASSYALEPRGLRQPGTDEATGAERLREWIELARKDIENAAPVLAVTVVGEPENELAKAADDADMLVVGGHGQGPLAEVFLGSVAAGAVRHAPCPVVVIPHEVAKQYR